jgi:hypothetical protein
MISTSRHFLPLLLLATAGLFGCGGSGPKLVTVQGKVLHRGKPVCPGSVQFEPADTSGNTLLASSLLGEDGSFNLRTFTNMKPHAGAMPGKYKVTLNLGGGTTPELAKYTQLKTTTEEIVIPAEGNKDLVIDLK